MKVRLAAGAATGVRRSLDGGVAVSAADEGAAAAAEPLPDIGRGYSRSLTGPSTMSRRTVSPGSGCVRGAAAMVTTTSWPLPGQSR